MSTTATPLENPRAQMPLEQAQHWGAATAMHNQVLATDAQSFIAYARSYPFTLEGAQTKFGIAIYDDMLKDACVAACSRKLKQEVLSKDFRLGMPAEIELTDANKEIFAFVNRCIEGLNTRIEDLAWTILDYCIRGHVLGEIDWKEGEGLDAGRDVLDDVRIIPWELYTLVLDAYGKFLGVIGRTPGRMPLQWIGPLMMPLNDLPGFVPYWKCFLLSHSPKPGDLRGTSRLDPVYNPYRIKKGNWANWYDYAGRFGNPKVFIALGATTVAKDPAKTAEQEWSETVAANKFDVLGMPPGSQVTIATLPGAWQPYVEINEACNKEIALGILGSPRAVMEAAHGSKADSQTSQDSVDEDTDYLGNQMCAAINRQIIKPLVQAVFGNRVPMPFLMMHEDTDDFVDKGDTVAALAASKFATPSQHPQLSRKLGIEPATQEEQAILEERWRMGSPDTQTPPPAPEDTPKTKRKKAA